MNQRRSMFAAIAVLALLSLVLTSGGALAQSAPTGATMPYAGRLTDPAGQPVADGQYDFVFTLYAAEKDDRAVWTETQLGVSVKSGEVHTTLGAIKPFPATVSDKVDYWLAVSVRGRGETAFTALSPRQALKAVLSTPNAVNALACPHSHFTDAWIGTNSAYGLDVDNRTGTGDGIRAFSGSTTQDFAAIWAENKAVTGNGTAVYAKSVKGTGVWAETTDFIGVVGKATAITDSVNSVGVWGEVNASGQYARGVVGWANRLTGINYGVWGQSDSNWGTGVYGLADSNDVNCTSGLNGTCRGVYGNSTRGNGVLGQTGVGVGVLANASGAGTAALAVTQGNGVAVKALSYGTGNLIEAWKSGIPDNRLFYVSNAGNVYADGTFNGGGADMAEMLPATDRLEAGDVLIIGADGNLTRSTQPNQASVVGVYSTQPGFLGGAADGTDLTGKVPLAVVGIVPVKVSAENGAIRPGDLLVASSVPGHAMRASVNPAPGTVIGKALAALDKGTGLVKMLVMLR